MGNTGGKYANDTGKISSSDGGWMENEGTTTVVGLATTFKVLNE